MANHTKITTGRSKKRQLPRKVSKIFTPGPLAPWEPFLTLRINSDSNQEKPQGNVGGSLAMADATQGAFRGIRSRDLTPGASRHCTSTSLTALPRLRSPTETNDAPDSSDPAPRPPKVILKLKPSLGLAGTKPKSALRQAPEPTQPARRQKRVRVVEPHESQDVRLPASTCSNITHSPLGIAQGDVDSTSFAMSQQKPKLKLSFSRVGQVNADQSTPTPAPETATRTPSIKLSFKPQTPVPVASPSVKKSTAPTTTHAAASSGKKRKREKNVNGSDDERSRPQAVRKLTLTAKPPAPAPAAFPILKFKQKAKVPKRALGVGYDSELEEREIDPVLLDGFILRMQPGEDCDYIQQHIANGTIGIHRFQGGADIRIRIEHKQQRRGIITIRGQNYAIALVDLPCIVEGMKSWDRKGWIKSVDISQMMLVLGKCRDLDEAVSFPLPPEVNPQTFQYANGLTPPMRDVRRRRFARTKRTRIDDIEAIERKVSQLIQADNAASQSSYQVFDHDPRLDHSSSGSEEYSGSEEDAEGEDDEEVDTSADYFGRQAGADRANAETTIYPESQGDDDVDDAVADFTAALADSDGEEEAETNGHVAHPSNTLHPPEEGASFFAVTSTSASPSATAAQTPASIVDTPGKTSDDDDGDDDANVNAEDSGDEESDEDEDDEAEKEDDEAQQRAKDQIEEMESKIREQKELLKVNTNFILRKKLNEKIRVLTEQVAMRKKVAGMAEDDGDGQ